MVKVFLILLHHGFLSQLENLKCCRPRATSANFRISLWTTRHASYDLQEISQVYIAEIQMGIQRNAECCFLHSEICGIRDVL